MPVPVALASSRLSPKEPWGSLYVVGWGRLLCIIGGERENIANESKCPGLGLEEADAAVGALEDAEPIVAEFEAPCIGLLFRLRLPIVALT